MSSNEARPERITMQFVAERAGVSPMTVSNTFRYPTRVQAETRQRILEIAAEYGYVPNRVAGDLASGQSRVIGAVIPSLKNSSFYQYIKGMQDSAATEGYELVLTLADTIAHERTAVETFLGLRVAGIVLVGNEHEAATVRLLEKAGTPLVESWVTQDPLDMAVGYCVADATRALVQAVLARGFRRIGYIGYAGSASQRFTERLPAFIESVSSAGHEPDLIHLVDQADGFGAGARALQVLAAIDPSLDALLCPTDILAAGALFECSRRGWAVPQRLAVTGWGDYEIASEITPGLTTVQPHAYAMGKAAVSMISDRRNGRAEYGITLNTGFRIIMRESI